MESVKVHRNRTDKLHTSNESDVGKGLPLKAESALSSSTSDDRNGESICNMKSFDSFGSDHDTSVSSTSESNLSDAFDEVAGGKDGIKNVPQCLLRDRLPEQNGMDEIKFSFLPEYLEVGQRPTKTNKKMFLSKRMSNKVSYLGIGYPSLLCFTCEVHNS